MAPAQIEVLRQTSVEAPQQHGTGCCWETWIGGMPAPERCGSETMPGKPWCSQHARLFARGKALQGRSHSLNFGAAIRSALYRSGS